MTASPDTAQPGPGLPATIAATLLGNAYLVLGTLLLSVVALLICWIPPRGRMVYRTARIWSRGLLLFAGTRLRAACESELEPGRRYLLMANHQSLLDIPTLIASSPIEIRFLAKRSLFRIPLFGWALRAGGFVSIDRGDRGRAQSGFTRALGELRTGASLVVFPEATRSMDGRLLPFKRGGFLLALRGGVPIVPVGIRGTLELRARDSYVLRPGRAEVRYGRPIDPSNYGVRELDRLESDLRIQIAELAGLDPAPPAK